ncbi:MAG TPA: thioesterase domain-containing protein, partial [Herpetosiphonaceae bacterium]
LRADAPGDPRIVAYVVEHRPAAQEHGSRQDLRTFLQERLPAYMVPSALVFLDALPLTASGKLDRRALPAPDQPSTAARAVVAPRDAWERALAEIWADLLHQPVVSVTDDFFALGGHSLLAVRLLSQMQQRFGRALPLATLLQAPTIAQLAHHLRAAGPETPWSPLVPLQPQGRRRPFFCIHPIGGTVLCYADLARSLGPEQPLYALQARGVEPGQVPHASIAAMAAEYLTAIRSVQPKGPYRLGGWSFGGVVAFEVAQQLRRQGQEVALVALVDSGPPAPDSAPLDATARRIAFARDLSGLLGVNLAITPADLDALSSILDRARQHGALPPDLDRDQIERLAAVFDAHLSALQHYAPAPMSAPVALLEASRPESVAESWRFWAADLDAQVVPGTHYTLLRPPHVEAVARWLRGQLDAVEADT